MSKRKWITELKSEGYKYIFRKSNEEEFWVSKDEEVTDDSIFDSFKLTGKELWTDKYEFDTLNKI